jgi:predicted nucleic acid-binding protein
MIFPNHYRVILDTCVLAPMPLCDTLLRLAEEPAFYLPFWSEATLTELQNVMITRGYTPQQAERRRKALEEAFPEALVSDSGLHPNLPCHPKDYHVLEAAIVSGADGIVTENLRDFQVQDIEQRFGIEIVKSDQFLVNQFDLNPDCVVEKLNAQATAISDSVQNLLTRLEKVAPDFAERVRRHA